MGVKCVEHQDRVTVHLKQDGKEIASSRQKALDMAVYCLKDTSDPVPILELARAFYCFLRND
jgi:hypothetical protein